MNSAASSNRHKNRKEIEAAATEVLRRHGLYSIPADPVTLANRNGIRVHNAKFSDDNISGMIAKRGDNITLLVNQSDPAQRKRFTIAHELGHHFLHLLSENSGDFVDSEVDTKIDLFRDMESPGEELTEDRRREIEANQFAAALLMPEEYVKSSYQQTQNISELARLFNVSETAIAIRLGQLGLDK